MAAPIETGLESADNAEDVEGTEAVDGIDIPGGTGTSGTAETGEPLAEKAADEVERDAPVAPADTASAESPDSTDSTGSSEPAERAGSAEPVESATAPPAASGNEEDADTVGAADTADTAAADRVPDESGVAEGLVDAEYADHAHEEDHEQPSDAGDSAERASAAGPWGRLLRLGRPRATRANVLATILALLLGGAIAAQVQLTQERGLSALSQSDLIRVLDDITSRSARLDEQIRDLERTRDSLKNGTGSAAEALTRAQKRFDQMGILAGTVGAQGPGITIRISDPQSGVTGPMLLDLIQELRDAGAESIDVGGVRIVASSFVADNGGTITIDGVRIDRPIEVKAIGDPATLSSAMNIPGGIVETVRQAGADAKVTETQNVRITSLHATKDFVHAKPGS